MKTLIFTVICTLTISVNFCQSLDTLSKKERIKLQSERLDSILENSSFKEKHFSSSQKKELKQLVFSEKKTFEKISFEDSLKTILSEDSTLRDPNIGISDDPDTNSIRFVTDVFLRDLIVVHDLSSSSQNEAINILSNSKLFFSDVLFELLVELGMYDNSVSVETFKDNLGYIESYNTIQYLFVGLTKFLEKNQGVENENNDTKIQEKLIVLSNRLKQLTNQRFYKFGFTDISGQGVKDIVVFTNNDMFTDFNMFGFNQDMNHTGGIHLNIGTDKLKMRLLPYVNGNDIVSYQAFEIGFDVYTPYLRDTNQLLKELSYTHDRPFASTFYFGRIKYRLHKNGHIRHTGHFNLMIIGGSQGRFFQELLHKDFIVSSIKPVGWDHQISNGGRLGYTIHHKFDFLISSPKAALFKSWKCDKMKFFNPFLSFESRFSFDRSFLGTSINISSRDFFNSSGSHGDFKLNPLQKFRFDYTLGFDLQYTIHNSTICDFGMFKRYDDDLYDDEYLSSYYLNKSQLVPWIWKAHLKINYRYRKATFFYELVLNRKEFKELPLDDVSNGEYKKILEDRFNYKVYGVGTIGLIFNL